MPAIIKQTAFSDSRRTVSNYRNFWKKLKSAFIELGAWVLAFMLFFAMMEVVIWVAAITLR